MKVSTEIDNNFGYEKITQLVDNIPLSNNIVCRFHLESLVWLVKSPTRDFGIETPTVIEEQNHAHFQRIFSNVMETNN